MSRASELRDGILLELQALEPDLRFEPFWVPNFPKEWLDVGPIIGVRPAQRQINSQQGPDFRRIGIEIVTFGVPLPSDETSTDPINNIRAQVESADLFDGITEELLDFWTPSGPLDGRDGKGIAGHSFQEVTQSTLFDAPQLQEFGLWASVFMVTYLDSLDE